VFASGMAFGGILVLTLDITRLCVFLFVEGIYRALQGRAGTHRVLFLFTIAFLVCHPRVILSGIHYNVFSIHLKYRHFPSKK